MEQNVIEKLYEDLKVDIKPGGQGFKYVKTSYVIDRLNKAFDNDWGTKVKSIDFIGDEVLVRVALTAWVTIDEGRIPLTQEGFGSAKKFGNSEIGNIAKSALSKAIKNAARNWGVGLFLDEGSSGTGASAPPPPNAMPSGGMPNMGGIPNSPTGGMPGNTLPPNIPPTTPQFKEPQMGSTPPPIANTMPNTPPNTGLPQMGAMPNNIPNAMTTPPSMPPSHSIVQAPPEVPQNTGQEQMTAVQKVAIEAKFGEQQTNFEQVAAAFYADRPSDIPAKLEEVSYTDAIALVTFLNSK